MPGWDLYSFGYHGDDGHYFHDNQQGVNTHETFGEGDIVGCGLVYPLEFGENGTLFYTKNGIFVRSFTLAFEYVFFL